MYNEFFSKKIFLENRDSYNIYNLALREKLIIKVISTQHNHCFASIDGECITIMALNKVICET